MRLLDPAAVGETLPSLARPVIGGRGAGWGGDYSASPCHTKYWQDKGGGGGEGEEKTIVLCRAIQNTGSGAGWGEDYIASPRDTKCFCYLHLSWCVRVGATRKLWNLTITWLKVYRLLIFCCLSSNSWSTWSRSLFSVSIDCGTLNTLV